jgi:Holliday junction resolvasome RuvABC endonuclease subunit
MSTFSQNLLKLIDTYHPDMIGWENLKSDNNPNTIRLLGEYTGILREMCESLDIPYQEAVPISIKAKIVKTKGSGKRGRKTKTDLAMEICRKYNLEYPVNKSGPNKGCPVTRDTHEFFNITDAIGIALYIYLKGEY